MGHRISKVYTCTGDDGSTGLGSGERIAKNHPRIETMGDIDELNCAIGLMLSDAINQPIHEIFTDIQHRLFDLGGELCLPDREFINAEMTLKIEHIIDELNATLPALKEFILPQGDSSTAHCHLARAICRRAERRLVSLSQQENINKHSLIYLNRLSDLLFVTARIFARDASTEESLWQTAIKRKPETTTNKK